MLSQTSKGFTPLALCVRKCTAAKNEGRKQTKEEIEKAAETKSNDDGKRPGTLAFDVSVICEHWSWAGLR